MAQFSSETKAHFCLGYGKVNRAVSYSAKRTKLNANEQIALQGSRNMRGASMRFAIAAVALALVNIVAVASDVEDTQIVEFFISPPRLEREFRGNLAQMKQQRPDLARVIDQLPARFSGEAAARKIAKVIAAGLTSNEKAQILAFMNTPSGQALSRLQSEFADMRSSQQAFQALPMEQRGQIEKFLQSQAAAKGIQLVNSEESAGLMQEYGRELICEEVKVSNQKSFAEYVRIGACAG